MINELFHFQRQAVSELRVKTALALNNYRETSVPQVVSLQAPTGSGKTIIMASLVEEILYGSDGYLEQPEAIFVWLSDSPQLNEQSKRKFELKADKIRLDQYVVITDENFDQEMLDDGHIYFLNTQKLGKAGNLSRHSDTRQYTIWETIENTTRNKADRLYFIIDEAHRGMHGKAAGTATTIMQRFIKGWMDVRFSAVPVVIGMSATAKRFVTLVGDTTTSTLHKVVITPAQVRASGLLKDRIIITYPEDTAKYNEMAVLQAATDEWQKKCQHWYQYSVEQHYPVVNPIFVIQVAAGTGTKLSNTNLDDVIATIEQRTGEHFKENEVVHTFGSTGTLQIHGLNVPHVEPSGIADDRRIKVVLFKENLSTGWDCPRAETMMSFRRAEDATYIAQLLGRMIRTPLQCHVIVDDFLNDVRLFLPLFNVETVQNVISELQNAEGGDIPTVLDSEPMEDHVYVPLSVHTGARRTYVRPQIPGQIGMFDAQDAGINAVLDSGSSLTSKVLTETTGIGQGNNTGVYYNPGNDGVKDSTAGTGIPVKVQPQETVPGQNSPGLRGGTATEAEGASVPVGPGSVLEREEIIKFINGQAYLSYLVRRVRINSYLKSLLSLAGLLTQNDIAPDANHEVKTDVTDMIRAYVTRLKQEGKYADAAKKVLEYRLAAQVFDAFGEEIREYEGVDLFTAAETDLDRQVRAADARLGGYNFPSVYGRRFLDLSNPSAYKIDCILFAASEECIIQLNQYAERKFHSFNDQYRKYIVTKSEKLRKQYGDIVADGDIVSKQIFTLPETISVKVERDGAVYRDHLFADENGNARIKLNGWEKGVLAEEQKRSDYVCWLRNYVRQSWSLRIPYEMNNETKEAYPDFIVIRRDPELSYVMDILEPHDGSFKDNLAKAKAFANYAMDEPRIGRIQLIREYKNEAGTSVFRRLDMAKGEVRDKVLRAINNEELDHIFDTDGI